MEKFTTLSGIAAPLPVVNVDTDMIIPKQYLKTIKRTGLGRGLFDEMRYAEDGSENPDFVLNKPQYRDAQILIAGENFGCGSSREHAPWALLDKGLSCGIAPGFADIFYNNCLKNGILPVVLPAETCEALAQQAGGGNHVFTVDLETRSVTAPDGQVHEFEIGESARQNLLEGLDEIGTTLRAGSDIDRYESQRRLSMPWLERQS